MPQVVVGAAIVRGGRLLAAQRSYPPAISGRWELPGGQVEDGEADADAVRRECVEELDVDVSVCAQVGSDVRLSARKVLRIYAAELTEPDAEPVAVEHKALRWVAAEDLDSVDWLPADRVLLPALRALLAGVGGC